MPHSERAPDAAESATPPAESNAALRTVLGRAREDGLSPQQAMELKEDVAV